MHNDTKTNNQGHAPCIGTKFFPGVLCQGLKSLPSPAVIGILGRRAGNYVVGVGSCSKGVGHFDSFP